MAEGPQPGTMKPLWNESLRLILVCFVDWFFGAGNRKNPHPFAIWSLYTFVGEHGFLVSCIYRFWFFAFWFLLVCFIKHFLIYLSGLLTI